MAFHKTTRHVRVMQVVMVHSLKAQSRHEEKLAHLEKLGFCIQPDHVALIALRIHAFVPPSIPALMEGHICSVSGSSVVPYNHIGHTVAICLALAHSFIYDSLRADHQSAHAGLQRSTEFHTTQAQCGWSHHERYTDTVCCLRSHRGMDCFSYPFKASMLIIALPLSL